jgi:hypothetical protein
MDVFGCEGQLTYHGFFDTATDTGSYAITGGTGDFEGATGLITPDNSAAADAPEGWFSREIYFSNSQGDPTDRI